MRSLLPSALPSPRSLPIAAQAEGQEGAPAPARVGAQEEAGVGGVPAQAERGGPGRDGEGDSLEGRAREGAMVTGSGGWREAMAASRPGHVVC